MSTVEITEAALSRTDHEINTTLPAGSEFLTANNTVAALRAAGRETLIYAARTNSTGALDWGVLRPADIVNRYVDSGIPTSVWVKSPSSTIGHAVVATGQVLARSVPSLPSRPTRGEYVSAFLVNDDQLGPNVRMAVAPGSAIAETSYTIQDAFALIIPLPSKVYLPAESAEIFAWDMVDRYARDWSSHKIGNAGKLGGSEALGDMLLAAHAKNELVARTYLTYGWKHKNRAIRNRLTNDVKKVVRDLDVPRYVYVTEFAIRQKLDDLELSQRRIIAHAVVDATAKHQDLEAVILFHAPGLCIWHAHGLKSSFVRHVIASRDDTEYFPKVRGSIDFAEFYATP
ncbi:MAG: hypothetical protein Q7T86_19370 [Hyphomicrobiaceae bacterium]|nr:hypothetical protein [Hyphomicrobiaceae bacterium]